MPTNSAGRNFRRTRDDSRFGTRKLAFYTLTADPEYGMIGNTQQGYSFRVNTLTGAVTFDADITSKGIGSMLEEWTGNFDEDFYSLTAPFTFNFLGFDSDDVYINSNGGISFGSGSSQYASDNTDGNTGIVEVFIANNDACILGVYTDDPEDGTWRVKVTGNTDYSNDTVVNMVWEAVFYENQDYVDFLVTRQPTDWNDYNDNQGDVYWGVTDGSQWVDGLSSHIQSFAPFTSVSDENWAQPNSIYYQVVRAIQEAGAEIYWLGTPHNASEYFTVDWSGLTFADQGDCFTFAIVDDADSPTATLDEVQTYTAVSTGTVVDPNWIEFDTLPSSYGPTSQGIFIGQPVVFTGTVFGGLVAGKKYYVADYTTYDGNSKFAITVSETVKTEVLDITYPAGVGGDPGLEFEPTQATGTMTAKFYNYEIEWEGTAGDVASSCCYNLTAPGIVPSRLIGFISDSGAFGDTSMWWIERANPSYGIFPAWWTSGENF